jgi:ADP-heptose:LPS heptosyltransferase
LSGLFLNEKIPEDMGKHAVDRYLDFLRHLGTNVGEPEFLIPISEENKKKVDHLLGANHIRANDRFAAVNPVAFWDTKLWGNENFANLCDRIMKELHTPIVLTGTDLAALSEIQSLMKSPAVNLGGKTGLRDLACLYRRSSLLITTDSGPMHIAAAVGTPVIALFGPTNPSRTGPYGKNHTVIRKDLSCSPCFLKKCETKTCMADISVDEVFEKAAEFLASSA